ncbi:hypothetical protein FOZ62_009068, partial [Perkinsus olseni]
MLFTDGNVLVFTKTFDWEHIWWTFLTRIYRLQLDGDGTWDMLWAIPEDRLVLQPVIPGVLDTKCPTLGSRMPEAFFDESYLLYLLAVLLSQINQYPDAGYVAIIPPFDEDVITLDLTADDVHT